MAYFLHTATIATCVIVARSSSCNWFKWSLEIFQSFVKCVSFQKSGYSMYVIRDRSRELEKIYHLSSVGF